MFYDCGLLNDYRYVYDSDDDSCELVDNKKLLDSNIVVSNEYISGSFDIPRLRMMYNFKNDAYSLFLNVCSYRIIFDNSDVFLLYLNFRIFDIVDVLEDYNMPIDELKSVRFGNSNKFLFMELYKPHLFYNSRSTKPSLRCIRYVFFGFPVPVQMFIYVMNLAKMSDFDSIDRAFNGALFKNMRVKSDLEWSLSKSMVVENWG